MRIRPTGGSAAGPLSATTTPSPHSTHHSLQLVDIRGAIMLSLEHHCRIQVVLRQLRDRFHGRIILNRLRVVQSRRRHAVIRCRHIVSRGVVLMLDLKQLIVAFYQVLLQILLRKGLRAG